MTWKLTHYARTRSPLAGVPWRDLTDEEFAIAEARYPEILERGYFVEAPAPAAEAAPDSSAEQEPDSPVEAADAQSPARRGSKAQEAQE